MTLGEKLSALRREHGYTQEQLAELLEVSRQAVSKWESGLAYPETDKLIRLSRLFDCSTDYLLRDEITERASDTTAPSLSSRLSHLFRERKSARTVLGMPLYHFGRNAHGFFAIGLRARGVFSIGLLSKGILSLGLLSIGILSVGLLSIGLISCGSISLGLLSIGSFALGLLSIGAFSLGIVSVGAFSIGCFSAGAFSLGKYIAIGERARAMIAIGEKSAVGSVYSELTPLSALDPTEILTRLRGITPWILTAVERIYEFFVTVTLG